MRIAILLLSTLAGVGSSAWAQTAAVSRPLTSIPYTPSLDTAAMDRAANPCENFYQYSCGNWIKTNPIPADQARWDVYAKLANENQQFLWGTLEEAAKARPGRSAVEQEIGDYFAACMDEAAIEQAGIKPLQARLTEIARLKNIGELPPVLADLHKLRSGSDMVFGFGSRQDFADASRVIASAGAGGLGLPDRDYYLKTDAKSEDIRRKYVAHIAKMLELLGDAPGVAAREASDILALETALAKATLTRVERRNPHNLDHKMKLAGLQALTPSFAWKTYLTGLHLPDAQADEFNVSEPAFYKALNEQFTAQSMDVWKAYMRWHLVHEQAPYLAPRFVQANFDFYSSTLRGVTALAPRWKRCVQYVDRDLGEALGQVFVQKAFSPDAKQKSVKITKEIEEEMRQEIKGLTWMSEDTKRNALAKLDTIVNKVGYPDRWRDYSSIKLDRHDFTGNVDRARAFEFHRDIEKIGKPVDRGEWHMTPPTVNAYYNPQMNDINFPAGVLQPPLFDMKMDDAPNYGNTGATIGHELTHGFDDQGRQFNAQGNLKDWWTAQDAKEFDTRAKCVVDQYGGYTVIDEIKINSKLTLGEDIADLGGTYLAYLAWKHATAKMALKPVDGLTPDQRFFVGMAQWACGDERPASRRVTAMTDPHSPGEYRINGVVANMPEFGEAFGCKVGQPMRRENACKIW